MTTKRLSTFTRNQRIGSVLLFFVVIIVQIVYFFIDFSQKKPLSDSLYITRLNNEIDSLRKIALLPKKDTIYPFNPNFITDYKGFVLGMKPDEIDRLLAFRKENKFVHSAEEFQAVTKVSDSLLAEIAPYFTFPNWANNAKIINKKENIPTKTSKTIAKQDINQATADDLKKIKGIGEVLSQRIVKYREKLQGFTVLAQVSEVYGIEKEVFDAITERFEVQKKPNIIKKNINVLTLNELSQVPYIKGAEQARKIVAFRSEYERIDSFADLLKANILYQEQIEMLQKYLFIEK
ncbi:MAG: helix-hairpin-helix domain-containing protein [Capnocytophaga sp.]|nr:helix-hairpin-helix domain-containing protein [Capnocytophaga sp.]